MHSNATLRDSGFHINILKRSILEGAAAHDASSVHFPTGIIEAFLKAAPSEAPPLILRAVPARA